MFWFSKNSIEPKINRLYEKFTPFANDFGYTFVHPALAVNGKPNILFLGNHSSGKSSFINHLLEGLPVQDTGVAPTDDCFTVIMYGVVESDVNGPAALSKLPAEFSGLSSLGPDFLHRLRVKFRNRPVLKKANFIDSPGMIDSAGEASTRSYDFPAAVRNLSEVADLLLLIFDPDKPGTTAETVQVLRQCLTGLEFKLRILMNKCDTFDSMYDFARAYGALCWNLGHVLRTKDLPNVYTTYLPEHKVSSRSKLDLLDFDRHREQVTAQIENATQRRADNLMAGVMSDFARLDVQSRMILKVRQMRFWKRVSLMISTAVTFVVAAAVGYGFTRWNLPPADGAGPWCFRAIVAYLVGLVLAIAAAAIAVMSSARSMRRFRAQNVQKLDELFEHEYAEDLVTGRRDDLRQRWKDVSPDVRSLLSNTAVKKLPTFAPFARMNLREAIAKSIPAIAARNR